MKKILFVTDVPFFQKRFGSHSRIKAMVDYLSNHFHVDIFYYGDEGFDEKPPSTFYHYKPDANLFCLLKRLFEKGLKRAINKICIVTRKHYNAISYYTLYIQRYTHKQIEKDFNKFILERSYDVIIFEYIKSYYLHKSVKNVTYKSVLDTHDIIHLRVQSFAKFKKVPSLMITKDVELQVFNEFDKVLFIQKNEFDYSRNYINNKAMLVEHPQFINPKFYSKTLINSYNKKKLNILFFGSSTPANYDSIRWFIDDVWLSFMLYNQFKLIIAGNVISYFKEKIRGVFFFKKKIEEVTEAYMDIDLAVNPVRMGSGLKIKNIEALSLGIPLITTSVGAEGIKDASNHAFLLANRCDDFHGALEKLKDAALRKTISTAAISYAEKRFNHDRCFNSLMAFIKSS